MPLILLSCDGTRLSTSSASAFWSLIPGHKYQNFLIFVTREYFLILRHWHSLIKSRRGYTSHWPRISLVIDRSILTFGCSVSLPEFLRCQKRMSWKSAPLVNDWNIMGNSLGHWPVEPRPYAEACNELRGPSPRLSVWTTQLRRNVATMASRWRHCVDLTGRGIESQIFFTDCVRLTTELKPDLT